MPPSTPGYGNNAIADGRNMLVNYITGLWIIQQCREKWVADAGSDISWDEIVQRSAAAGPATAYIDVDDPDFGLPQADMPSVIVAYCERKGMQLANTIGTISRCVYESLVLKYRSNLETLERLTGKRLDVLHLVGGGVQNRTLCQWTADAMGIPVMARPDRNDIRWQPVDAAPMRRGHLLSRSGSGNLALFLGGNPLRAEIEGTVGRRHRAVPQTRAHLSRKGECRDAASKNLPDDGQLLCDEKVDGAR